MEQGNSPVKVIPFNQKAPRPKLVLDKVATDSLPESRLGTRLWMLKKQEKPMPVASEQVLRKAHVHSLHRTCPWHGEVKVTSRTHAKKSLASVEGLSCGHSLLITRIAGSLKRGIGRNASDWEHRGWLFTFKNTTFLAS